MFMWLQFWDCSECSYSILKLPSIIHKTHLQKSKNTSDKQFYLKLFNIVVNDCLVLIQQEQDKRISSKFPLTFCIFMRLNTFADYDDEIANIDQKKVEVTDRG